jgi:hypothetical protein
MMSYIGVTMLIFLVVIFIGGTDAAEEKATSPNQYGQVVGNIQVTIPDGTKKEFRVFDQVSPQYQAQKFCDMHEITCAQIIQAALDMYSSVNQIGIIKIGLGSEATVDLRIFDSINPEHYRALFCAGYFINPEDCDGLIAAATRTRNSANLVGIVPVLLNNSWDIDYRVYDNVSPDVQSDALCVRYFISAEYCVGIKEAARKLFDSTGMVAVIPLALSNDEIVDFKTYDKLTADEAAQEFCSRYSLPAESCGAIVDAARAALGGSSLVGVLPLQVDEDRNVEFRIYDSMTVEKQSENLCTRYSIPSESCVPVMAAARNMYNSANLMGVIPLVLSNATDVVYFKIYDSVSVNQQTQNVCGRYFLPTESCAAVSAAASAIFGSANLVGTIPIDLGSSSAELHLYDSLDCESQAQAFCSRQFVRAEDCNALMSRAMELFAGAGVVGVLPLNLGQGPIDLKLYSSHTVGAQIDSFCLRNMVAEDSCQKVRDMFTAA